GRKSTLPRHSVPTANTWSLGEQTERCKSGARGTDERSEHSAPTAEGSRPLCSAATADSWPQQARRAWSNCGTRLGSGRLAKPDHKTRFARFPHIFPGRV